MKIIITNVGQKDKGIIMTALNTRFGLPLSKCIDPKSKMRLVIENSETILMATTKKISKELIGTILQAYPGGVIIGIVNRNQTMPHLQDREPFPKGVVLHQFLKPEGVVSFIRTQLAQLDLAPV